MTEIQAIILGLVQGLTEFLPVSSSGHLVIAKSLFGIEVENLSFEIVVHSATVISTIVAFRKEIFSLLKGLFDFKYNSQTRYLLMICVSMIPILIVGLFFKDAVEQVFGSGLMVVGCMLLLTSLLLFVGERISIRRQKDSSSYKAVELGYKQAFVIGLAQSVAVLPGLSRSGSTIATGLMLGLDSRSVTQFSFLMVLVPILGETFLEIVSGGLSMEVSGISLLSLACGALSAFVSGYIACRWMIKLVQKAKLRYFSLYCICMAILCFILDF
ncbi:MAG: undecaprenyl-diphosphate phosphatase [Bacteroidales bacterium]|nr:undecaprenyl-diphosphate phosphatase [Bacteroidales bacterium]